MTRPILFLSLSILASPIQAPAISLPRQANEPPPQLIVVFTAIVHAAHEADLPLWLAFNVAYAESSFHPGCQSRRDGHVIARGLFQISKQYQDELVVKFLGWDPRNFDWRNPVHSAKLGCRILANYLKRFGTFGAVCSFNAGPGRYMELWNGRPLPTETVTYCQRVL